MKIKYMMIVSIILAIITIGGVSAAENITDDVQVTEDVADDIVEITDEAVQEDEDVLSADIDEENVIADEGSEDVLTGDETEYTFRVVMNNNVLSNIGVGDSLNFGIMIPADSTGQLTLALNGKTYDLPYVEGNAHLSVMTTGWNLGSYSAVVKYSGDDRYAPCTQQVDFELQPGASIPSYLAVGENDPILIYAPGLNGWAEIVIRDSSNGNLINDEHILISNGTGEYSLSNLEQGRYRVDVYVQAGNYNVQKTNFIMVMKNSPEITVSPSKTVITDGESAILNIAGPQNVQMYIYVDGEMRKIVYLYYGQTVEHFSGLSVGTHNIKVYTPGGWDFYSNVFTITVKAKEAVKKDVIKLALSKVKVKKSAKKLVIKATLKINGKAKKGLKVKFKFGKKSYTAKTSAKGVAKITVKKTVLKKLKVGKKITYKATYGKTVKKVTVKVRK